MVTNGLVIGDRLRTVTNGYEQLRERKYENKKYVFTYQLISEC